MEADCRQTALRKHSPRYASPSPLPMMESSAMNVSYHPTILKMNIFYHQHIAPYGYCSFSRPLLNMMAMPAV